MSKKIRGGMCFSNPTEKGVKNAASNNELKKYIEDSLKCNYQKDNTKLIVTIIQKMTNITDLSPDNITSKIDEIKEKLFDNVVDITKIYEEGETDKIEGQNDKANEIKEYYEREKPKQEEERRRREEDAKKTRRRREEERRKHEKEEEERKRETEIAEEEEKLSIAPNIINPLVATLSPEKQAQLKNFLKMDEQSTETIGEKIRNNINIKTFYKKLMLIIHPDKCKDPSDNTKCKELSQIIESIKPSRKEES